ncbi:hypothetical protein QFZ77_004564 [Paenibacillus sp. V4I3]|nr:hypothetical protein [Paenibacillus sp. V4I3]
MECCRQYADDVNDKEHWIYGNLMHRRAKILMRNITQVNLKTSIKKMPENEDKRKNPSNALQSERSVTAVRVLSRVQIGLIGHVQSINAVKQNR